MNKFHKIALVMVAVLVSLGYIQEPKVSVYATEQAQGVIKNGVFIDSVDVGGMDYDEAKSAVKERAKEKAGKTVRIRINKEVVNTTLGDLGYKWDNKSVIQDAVDTGKSGNIIKRYKDDLDLQEEGMKYDVEMSVDEKTLKKKLEEVCEPYSIEAKNASLKATGSGFKIVPEQEGVVVDSDATAETLYAELTKDGELPAEIEVDASTKVSQPQYTSKDCEKVSNTPMGSFATNFLTGGAYENRNRNIENGVEKLDGNVIYPGEQFSCNAVLAPWTEDNGWYPAGTYVGGGVEDSLGGGICQVSSTLYNALLRAEIKVVTRFSHSMSVSYVDLAADAALAGDYKDLVFENDTDAPIYIQGVYQDGRVAFNIYGHDTRDEGHSVSFESKLIETIPVETEEVKDPTQPEGYTHTESTGHVGYIAELWKIIYENGEEVDRELLHTSKYAMSPTKVIKGTASTKPATTDPTKKNEETTKAQEKTTVAQPTEAATQKAEEAE